MFYPVSAKNGNENQGCEPEQTFVTAYFPLAAEKIIRRKADNDISSNEPTH